MSARSACTSGERRDLSLAGRLYQNVDLPCLPIWPPSLPISASRSCRDCRQAMATGGMARMQLE